MINNNIPGMIRIPSSSWKSFLWSLSGFVPCGSLLSRVAYSEIAFGINKTFGAFKI